ncbi:MAG: hypothetical protein L0387_32410 [Acidobacteria bacterium]|nr:hypothetical protein [Acidobacteriota bacterium]
MKPIYFARTSGTLNLVALRPPGLLTATGRTRSNWGIGSASFGHSKLPTTLHEAGGHLSISLRQGTRETAGHNATRLVRSDLGRYDFGVKKVTVQLPKEQLSQILTEAQQGDVIVLTDGERRMELESTLPHGGALDLDLEEDSSELEAELLKAVKGDHAPFSDMELRSIADCALREHRARRAK